MHIRTNNTWQWSAADWAAVSDRSWLREKARRVMTGFHIPDYDQIPNERHAAVAPLTKIDPPGIARKLKQAGVEVFYFYSKCHYGNAYFPSRLGHVHSALKGRDLFGELTRACLDEGILPGSVYEFSDNRIRVDHPAWCHSNVKFVDHKKSDITDANIGTSVAGPCLNGPYGEMVIGQLCEVARDYPLCCIWVDFLGLFGSVDAWRCPYCNDLFRKEFGRDFPGTARMDHDEYAHYIKWRMAITDAYTAKLFSAIRELRPDIGITMNFFAFNPIGCGQTSWEIAGKHADFLGKDLFTYRVGSLEASWKPRALRGASGQAPGEILLDGNMALPGDLATAKPLDGYRAEVLTARFAGAFHCGSINPSCAGEYDDAIFALLRKTFMEQQALEPWLRESEFTANIGILRSTQTLCFDQLSGGHVLAGGLPNRDREDAALHYREFLGWTQVLIENHELWDHRHDAEICPAGLAGLNALILPQATCLNASQVRAVRNFVAAGGTLIASGCASLKDGEGRLHANFALSDVMGVDYAAPFDPDQKRIYQEEPRLDQRPEWVSAFTPALRGHLQVMPHTSAAILARTTRLMHASLTYAEEPSENPSIVFHNYGQGRAYYLSALLGEQYLEDGQHTVARLLRAILNRALQNQRLFELVAPGSVEFFVRRMRTRDDAWLVGCVHAASGVSRSEGLLYNKGSLSIRPYARKFDAVEEMPVLNRVTLRINTPSSAAASLRVTSLPDNTSIPLQCQGNVFEADILNLRVGTLLLVEGLQT